MEVYPLYRYERIAREKAQREHEKQRELEEIKTMQEIQNRQNKRYISLMGSSAHTYGNALAFMQNYIIKLFPDNMFKTTHVNSKIAHRQIRSTPHEFVKKLKPMIIFRPRIPEMTEDRFLEGTRMIERHDSVYSMWGNEDLEPFILDLKNDLVVKYKLNRSVMYVDVVIILATLMQQLDYYNYIQNAVEINRPFFIPTCFESYLPQDMLSILSQIINIPIHDDAGHTKEFLDHLNGMSKFPITYKLQGSSQTKEFYRYYPVNILTNITDLDKDDGERTGAVMSDYKITFTVRMEYFSTGFYYIFNDNIYNIRIPKYDIDTQGSDIIPVYTDVFEREDLNLQQGWVLYNRASFRLDDVNDAANIGELLNNSIEACIDYHRENGLGYFEFIDIKVKKQGTYITNGVEYDLNWDNMTVKFNSPSLYHTYTFYICINLEYINNLVKTIYKLK